MNVQTGEIWKSDEKNCILFYVLIWFDLGFIEIMYQAKFTIVTLILKTEGLTENPSI